MSDMMKETLQDKGYKYIETVFQDGSSQIHIVYSIKYECNFIAKVTMKSKKNQLYSLTRDPYESEKKALCSIYHPYVICLFDSFEDDYYQFLILEYCSNGTLADVIKTKGCIESSKLAFYALQISKAIKACHDQKFSHNDIKPENLILDSYDRIHLTDFGLSRKHSQETELNMTFCYTAAFAAPEILNNQEHNEFLSDIWALGVTFYQMATGEIPFLSNDKFTSIELMKKGFDNIPDNVDPNFFKIIKNCLQYDPEKRPSIDTIIEQLIISQSFENPCISKPSYKLEVKRNFSAKSFAHLSKLERNRQKEFRSFQLK